MNRFKRVDNTYLFSSDNPCIYAYIPEYSEDYIDFPGIFDNGILIILKNAYENPQKLSLILPKIITAKPQVIWVENDSASYRYWTVRSLSLNRAATLKFGEFVLTVQPYVNINESSITFSGGRFRHNGIFNECDNLILSWEGQFDFNLNGGFDIKLCGRCDYFDETTQRNIIIEYDAQNFAVAHTVLKSRIYPVDFCKSTFIIPKNSVISSDHMEMETENLIICFTDADGGYLPVLDGSARLKNSTSFCKSRFGYYEAKRGDYIFFNKDNESYFGEKDVTVKTAYISSSARFSSGSKKILSIEKDAGLPIFTAPDNDSAKGRYEVLIKNIIESSKVITKESFGTKKLSYGLEICFFHTDLWLKLTQSNSEPGLAISGLNTKAVSCICTTSPYIVFTSSGYSTPYTLSEENIDTAVKLGFPADDAVIIKKQLVNPITFLNRSALCQYLLSASITPRSEIILACNHFKLKYNGKNYSFAPEDGGDNSLTVLKYYNGLSLTQLNEKSELWSIPPDNIENVQDIIRKIKITADKDEYFYKVFNDTEWVGAIFTHISDKILCAVFEPYNPQPKVLVQT